MKRYSWIVMVAAAALALAGCGGLFGPAQSDSAESDTAEDLAMMASSAAAYHEEAVLAAVGAMEKEDLEDESAGAKTVLTDTIVRTLPDGTVITIERSWDDNDTPDDPEDDWVTVIRTFDLWEDATKVETTRRRRRPTAAWSGWEDGFLVQDEGTNTVEVNGLLVRNGTIVVTWELVDDEVVLRRIVKESQGPDRAGAIIVSRTTIDYGEEGETKTSEKIRITATEGEVVVHSFTYEEITDPDDPEVTYTKITRDDGCYVIVIQPGNVRLGTPRITEHYTADGVLRARVQETRNRSTGEVSILRTVYLYDENGDLVETVERSGTINYEFTSDGEGVVITKEFDNGRTVVVEITEREEGYEITRGGTTYIVELSADQVVFYDVDGNLIATVTLGEDGTWTVQYPDGESEDGTLAMPEAFQ